VILLLHSSIQYAWLRQALPSLGKPTVEYEVNCSVALRHITSQWPWCEDEHAKGF